MVIELDEQFVNNDEELKDSPLVDFIEKKKQEEKEDLEEAESVKKLEDFYKMLNSLPREQRRKIMKDYPKRSDIIKKTFKAKNLKDKLGKQNKSL